MPKRVAKLFCPPLPQFLKVGRAIAPSSFVITIYDINIKVKHDKKTNI
jgi:hypothetical protein